MITIIGIALIVIMFFTMLHASLTTMEEIRNEKLEQFNKDKNQ